MSVNKLEKTDNKNDAKQLNTTVSQLVINSNR